MHKYDKIKSLKSAEFRRLTGVSKSVFQLMIAVVKAAERVCMKHGGRPSRLKIEDKLLMTLEYLREYRTYFHLGQSYGLSESTCYRNCRWVEDVLIRDKTFALPGKKVLLRNDSPLELILVDATETPIERPKKTNAKETEGQKQKQQTKVVLFGKKEKAHDEKSTGCVSIIPENTMYGFL